MNVRSEPLSLSDLFEGLTNVLKPATENRGLALSRHGRPRRADPAHRPGQAAAGALQLPQQRDQVQPRTVATSRLSARPAGDAAGGVGRVRIEVADQGPGIAADQHELIFEKFRQIDGSATRQHSGTGLGLAISRELTQLLSGTIGVDSTPGTGATFWIALPVRIEASVQDVRRRMMLT